MNRWAGLCFAACVFGAMPARADDCYQIKAGAKLYGDVMGDAVIGETTTSLVAWQDGWAHPDEPTRGVMFVAVKGGIAQEQLFARVGLGDATAIACPRRWNHPGTNVTVWLSWPDARSAGKAIRSVLAARRKGASPRFGRACFASSIPGVKATVCAPVSERVKPSCVALEPRTPVFARPTTAARLGETTTTVVGEEVARVDDEMSAVRIADREASQFVYVRTEHVHGVQCPPPRYGGVLSSEPPNVALLPDGSDAGYRTWGEADSLNPSYQAVRARGRTLKCFDDTPVEGLTLHVCSAEPAGPAK